jgi:hypothetical protein
MGNTITIVSRKKFHFRNPDPAVDLMGANLDAAASKNRDKYKDAVFITSGDMQLQQAPDWVNKTLGPDLNKNGADKNAQNILTWQHALKDGDIYQINVVPEPEPVEEEIDNAKSQYERAIENNKRVAAVKNQSPDIDLSGAAAAQQAEQARASKLAEEAKEKRANDAKEVVILLTPMTKAQIVEYAEKEHELTLDPAKATKEELIESIQNQILKGEVA